jgi:hypothetical protein
MILSPFIPKPLQLLRVRNYQSIPLRDKWELPRVSGVYFCLRGWQILYIGKSTSIHHRWNSYRYGEHHRLEELLQIDEAIGDVDIHWCEYPEALIGFIEAVEIRRFRPRLNKRIEPIWDNINLAVIVMLLKYWFWQMLIAALSSAVIGLIVYHLVLGV